MIKLIIAGLICCFALSAHPQKKILIIQDEVEQMEVLSDFLVNNDNRIEVKIIDQKRLPEDILKYGVVILYVHRELYEPTETKIINYTKNGGRFICLHHSISSKKAENKFFFDFLGIQLDGTEKSNDAELPGEGYAWVEPVVLTIVNLNPHHFVTSNNISWEDKILYQSSDFPGITREYPSISFPDSEVYLNHKFTDGREKTVLLGLKFFDERNKQLFMQDRAGWYKKWGKGDIFYLMPGHSSLEFRNKKYSQMILNAINFAN